MTKQQASSSTKTLPSQSCPYPLHSHHPSILIILILILIIPSSTIFTAALSVTACPMSVNTVTMSATLAAIADTLGGRGGVANSLHLGMCRGMCGEVGVEVGVEVRDPPTPPQTHTPMQKHTAIAHHASVHDMLHSQAYVDGNAPCLLPHQCQASATTQAHQRNVARWKSHQGRCAHSCHVAMWVACPILARER